MLVLLLIFFFNDPATTESYTYGHTLSLHDALPIYAGVSAEDASTAAGLVADAVALPDINRGAALDIVLGRRPNKSVPRPLDSLAFRAAFDLRLDRKSVV